jgi:hypothetical protein
MEELAKKSGFSDKAWNSCMNLPAIFDSGLNSLGELVIQNRKWRRISIRRTPHISW